MRFLRRGLGSPVAWAATAVFLAAHGAVDDRHAGIPQPRRAAARQQRPAPGGGGGLAAPGDGVHGAGGAAGEDADRLLGVDGQDGNWAGGTLLPGVRAGVAPRGSQFYALFSLQARDARRATGCPSTRWSSTPASTWRSTATR